MAKTPKPSKKIRVIRIDPERKTIAAIQLLAGKNADQVLREVKRVLRAETVGHRELLPAVDDAPPLMIAGGLAVDYARPMFRLRGCEEHAGIGILFGRGAGGGMVDVPVTAEWVQKRLVWLPGEDDATLVLRAEAAVPSLAPELVAAMLATIDGGPLAAGDSVMWVPADQKEVFPALMQHGLTDEVTKGQRLTRFGDKVLEILKAAA